MTEKSHVSMTQKFCPMCGKMFDGGELLLETRVVNGKLLKSLDRYTCTGVDLCPEHAAMVESGEYVAFFVCEPRDCVKCKNFTHIFGSGGAYEKPSAEKCKHKRQCNGQHYRQEGMFLRRTGDGFMMRVEAAKNFFNVTVAPVNHCDQDLFDKMKSMAALEPDQETCNQDETKGA